MMTKMFGLMVLMVVLGLGFVSATQAQSGTNCVLLVKC